MEKVLKRDPVSSIFISHSHYDKQFVRRLARDLRFHGIRVWVDEAELNIGDSLIQMISDAIETSEYFAVVVSSHSVESKWVLKELQIAMTEEIEGQRVVVLPLLVDDCDLPAFLTDKVYADFRSPDQYEDGLRRVLRRLGVTALAPKTGTHPRPTTRSRPATSQSQPLTTVSQASERKKQGRSEISETASLVWLVLVAATTLGLYFGCHWQLWSSILAAFFGWTAVFSPFLKRTGG